VRQVYSIGDAEAEVIEAQVMNTSPISGNMIRDINIPEGVYIAAVQKGDKVIRPNGDTRIDDGDIVVIFSLVRHVGEVERLLQVRIDFF
jgi:trk system potassium uptake protein TrkA